MFKESLRRRLEKVFPHQELMRWYDPLMLQKDEQSRSVRIFFPHPFFRKWFLETLREDFEKEAAAEAGGLSFFYEESGRRAAPDNAGLAAGQFSAKPAPSFFERGAPLEPEREQTFSSFLVNKKNSFPLTAAKRSCALLAAKGRLPYSPLVFYGKSCSGKSHLLAAMCAHAREKGLLAHHGDISYLDRICVSPGRYAQGPEHCVCLDDVQRVSVCPDLQEALAALIDSFAEAGKLLALAFERHPEQLPLRPTLKSRLAGGLAAELKRPDLDIRLQYVQRLAERKGLQLSKEQMLALCRRHLDIRGIHGVLTSFAAMHSLSGTSPAACLDDMLPAGNESPQVTANSVIQTVALYFRVSAEDLTGKSRDRNLAFARHTAIYLCRELLGLSLVQIGHIFGSRDHSSILYSIKKIKEMQVGDKERNMTVEKLRQMCLGIA